MKIDLVAKICHEVNRAYCEATGDYSQKPWESAPVWQTDSAKDGVRYKLNNPSITPANIHQNWLREKIKLGWEYGPVKDSIKKLHPCMVVYEKLPPHQRIKDMLFAAVVEAHVEARVDEEDGA